MTLLITCFAAIITTLIWYMTAGKSNMRLGTLALMYWGASIMWFVDAVFEYIELRDAFFVPEQADMINDAFLGFCVVALGLMIWLVIVLIKDPKGAVRAALLKKGS